MSLKETGKKMICRGPPRGSADRKIQNRLFLCFALITGVIFFTGCASLSILLEPTPSIDEFQAYIGPDGMPILPGSVDTDVQDVEILLLNSDMVSALDNAIARAKNSRARMEALVKFLDRSFRYDATADNYGAKTAREAFEAGTGNCLSLSNLFLAMARRAGLKANYQEIPTPPNWERDGEVLFSTRHIAVSIDIKGGVDRMILLEVAGEARTLALDGSRRYFFIPTMLGPFGPDMDLYSARTIPDTRAFAQYYNNIGSRHMSEGNGADAFRYYVKAVKTDPELGFAWSNLGVVYSRNGQFEAAQAAYQVGLAVSHGAGDVTALSILSNMVELYKRSGDEERAALYKDKVASFRGKNPYYQYTIAKKAFNDSLYEQSVRSFKTAIRLKNDEHLFYYGLALAYDKLGNRKKAEKNIKKAKYYAFSEARKMYYEQVRRDIVK